MRPGTLRNIAKPEEAVGFYLVALRPKGWRVPARIEATETEIIVTTDEAETRYLRADWAPGDHAMNGTAFADPLLRILLFGAPCPQSEYEYRLHYKRFAQENAPDHPCLHPYDPVDLNLVDAELF